MFFTTTTSITGGGTSSVASSKEPRESRREEESRESVFVQEGSLTKATENTLREIECTVTRRKEGVVERESSGSSEEGCRVCVDCGSEGESE